MCEAQTVGHDILATWQPPALEQRAGQSIHYNSYFSFFLLEGVCNVPTKARMCLSQKTTDPLSPALAQEGPASQELCCRHIRLLVLPGHGTAIPTM